MIETDTLANIVDATRDEAGYHPSSASTSQVDPRIKSRVIRTQRVLYTKFNWPALNTLEAIPILVGERFYDVPARSNLFKAADVYALWNLQPIPLTRGIGVEEYAAYDSERNEGSDPLRRWDLRRTDTGTQIEFWPIPLTATSVRISSRLPIQPFSLETDVSTLDATLISMFAAAALMEDDKADGAASMRANAQEYLVALQAEQASLRTPVSFGEQKVSPRGVQSVVAVR